MPQMMPMIWTFIFLLTIILFLMNMILLSSIFLPFYKATQHLSKPSVWQWTW